MLELILLSLIVVGIAAVLGLQLLSLSRGKAGVAPPCQDAVPIAGGGPYTRQCAHGSSSQVMPPREVSVLYQGSHLAIRGITNEEACALSLKPSSRFPRAMLDGLSVSGSQAPTIIGTALNFVGYRVVFSRSVQAALNSGQDRLMQHGPDTLAVAVNSESGLIEAIGRVLPGLNAIALGAIGFQVATVICAQTHLARINSQIETIGRKLEEIRQLLTSRDFGMVYGNEAYVNQIIGEIKDALPSGDMLSNYRFQLETIERESLQSIHTGRERIDSRLRIVRERTSGDRPSKFERKEEQEFFEDVSGFLHDCHLLIAASYVRVRALAVQQALFGPDVHRQLRDDIATERLTVAELSERYFDEIAKLVPDQAWWSHQSWLVGFQDTKPEDFRQIKQSAKSELDSLLNTLSEIEDQMLQASSEEQEFIAFIVFDSDRGEWDAFEPVKQNRQDARYLPDSRS